MKSIGKTTKLHVIILVLCTLLISISCTFQNNDKALKWLKKININTPEQDIRRKTPKYIEIDWTNKIPDSYEDNYYRYNTYVIEPKGNLEIQYQLQFTDGKFQKVIANIQRASSN